MVDIAALKKRNEQRWNVMKVTRNFVSVSRALIDPKAKARYQAVEAKTGVPWFVIAVIHEREASQRWDTQLGQGDPLNRVSVHVPKGRGPFSTWEEGALDALVNTSPYAARNHDWSPGGALTLLEEYNGFGYANGPTSNRVHYPPQASPYVWSGTDQYVSGKYIRDDVFDPNTIDVQLGCAGLIKTMMSLDSSIKFGSPTLVQPPATVIIPPKTVQRPSPPVASAPQTSQSIFSKIIAAIAAIFRRKP